MRVIAGTPRQKACLSVLVAAEVRVRHDVRHRCPSYVGARSLKGASPSEHQAGPAAEAVDRTGDFPDAAVASLASAGLLGLASAQEVGGPGGGPGDAVRAVERLSPAPGTGMPLPAVTTRWPAWWSRWTSPGAPGWTRWDLTRQRPLAYPRSIPATLCGDDRRAAQGFRVT